MAYRSRSTIEYQYRMAVLVLGIVLAVALGGWLLSDADPAKVLGCVWNSATAEASATTDPSCLNQP